MSGTEPKFKIYFNLYGDNHEAVVEKQQALLAILIQKLELEQRL